MSGDNPIVPAVSDEFDLGDLDLNFDEPSEVPVETYTAEELANAKGTVGVISLGCSKNTVDSEQMLGRFVSEGYLLVADPMQADMLVVNTCGFIADAERESRESIDEMAHLKKLYPNKKLIVTGCLSQRYGAKLLEDHPQIDLLLGAGKYDTLIPLMEAAEPPPVDQVAEPDAAATHEVPRLITTGESTAYVKIAEGCNNSCTFCIIPKLRGPFRSRTLDDIASEVEQLTESGSDELILISQDTTWYGRDLQERSSLTALLQKILNSCDAPWIRMLYLYPTLVKQELLSLIAQDDRLLPYFDIPLQHADSNVLKRMQRSERLETVRQMVADIRSTVPGAIIRSTFIVGFPGETEQEFQTLLDFIQESQLDWVGVFTYSDEEGTAAFNLPNKVSSTEAESRRERLMAMQQPITSQRLKRWLGQTMAVLVEEFDEEHACFVGRFWGQAPEVDGQVLIQANEALEPGHFVPVSITEVLGYDLYGDLVDLADLPEEV
ncbi:30S ribosomal protein S12 methylthiotransferase RimO [Magnetococcus sp. PR-3]|uniref:30S ribosomal protein S12 methylthiotransferase RimO n=1 Tax=Magnetococcus sp. PR-3 TaxID=3120355 RepID=UPI002FCE1AA6